MLLTPIIAPNTTAADIEEAKAGMEAAGLDAETFIEILTTIYNGDLKGASFAMDTAQDEEGNIYSAVHILPSFRFTKDGVRYYGTGDITVNFDAMLDIIRELAQ